MSDPVPEDVRPITVLPPPDARTCESCGRTADVRLKDGSMWCLGCNEAANNLGYDQFKGRFLPGRKQATGGR